MNRQILHFFITLLLFLFCFWAQAQKVELSYYLPDVTYNSKITTPEEFLGWQPGEWHISHDKLTSYFQLLASQSDRMQITEYARSYENRPLIYLTISNVENMNNIEEIRKDHVNLTVAAESGKLNISEMPIVLYQGYSVHGNESSGANAAVLLAYYMAAAQGERVEKLLKESVVLLDPCYNPDGLHRFSSWVNMHKSKTLVSDPSDREYNETWPGGRTNHYWFDLNRDWLLLTHPESRGRIKTFHHWKPNVLTDHHEMGTNSTFFFQPGVPERTNPNTPQINQDLTEDIGEFHAKALDKIGSSYYTKESFDDFYYGKGSTYPDIQGSIGILFEQASSRGHYQESINGILDFPFTIRNQVVTSFSTQDAALELREEILKFQRDFYQNAASDSKKDKSVYEINKAPDYNKALYFANVLSQHDIQVYDDGEISGKFYVPIDQKQSKLIKAIFEIVTDFRVNIFYDVSTWNFPAAFNMKVVNSSPANRANWTLFDSEKVVKYQKIIPSENMVSFAFEWVDMNAGTLLNVLLKDGFSPRMMHEPFTAMTVDGDRNFDRGTVVVKAEEDIDLLISRANEYNVKVFGLTSGFNPKGVMLGSPSSFKPQEVNALMLIGNGVNAYDAGEIWFQMDQRLEIPLSKIELSRFSRANLERYNVLIMPDGSYRSLKKADMDRIKKWVENGGTLIAFKRAMNKLNGSIIAFESIPSAEREFNTYADRQAKSAEHVIGGAIFQSKIDVSYPLFYGYSSADYFSFKRGTLAIKPSGNVLANPMIYNDPPLFSGYSSTENKDRIKNTSGLAIYGVGRGRVVCSLDNPLFRGYWRGGNKLFENMLFISGAISGVGLRED
jgi:hypothetical protein